MNYILNLVENEYIWEQVRELTYEKLQAFDVYLCKDLHDPEEKDPELLIAGFIDAYIGVYANPEDFTKQYVKVNSNIPKDMEKYFDYKTFTEELFPSTYLHIGGYVFKNTQPALTIRKE